MKYVALLRGINIGGNNKISMAELKLSFERLEFSDVVTYINSGNVIFTPADADPVSLVKQIEAVILEDFGLPIRVIVRSAENIQLVLSELDDDWHNNSEQKTDIMFLWEEVSDDSILNKLIQTDVDTLRYIDGAVVWHIAREDFSKSGMKQLAKNPVYKLMTVRNSNTLRKLAVLLNS